MDRTSSRVTVRGTPSLSEIVRQFADARESVTLADISRRLGIERGALDGMIQLLVRKGRLREVRGAADCGACGSAAACHSVGQGGAESICYEVVRSDT